MILNMNNVCDIYGGREYVLRRPPSILDDNDDTHHTVLYQLVIALSSQPIHVPLRLGLLLRPPPLWEGN